MTPVRLRGPGQDRPGPVRDPGPSRPDAPAGEGLLEAEVHRFEHEARRLAAGGWRRALIGIAMGAVVGALIRLGLPADADRDG